MLYLSAGAYSRARGALSRCEELVPRAVLAVLEHCVESDVAAAACGVCVVCDLDGCGVVAAASLASLCGRIAAVLRGGYPLRFRRCIVVGGGAVSIGARALVRRHCPKLSSEGRAVFVDSKDGLLRYIAPDQLPFRYGGSRSLDYDAFVRDCRPMFLAEAEEDDTNGGRAQSSWYPA